MAIIAACICWSIIIDSDEKAQTENFAEPGPKVADSHPSSSFNVKDILFIFILALGIIERLSRLANLLSIERDWIPKLAASDEPTQEPSRYDLTGLNAVMARIDLICKLGSPIVVSMLLSFMKMPRLGVVILAICNIIFWPLEYWTARKVWNSSAKLRNREEAVRPENPWPSLTSMRPMEAILDIFHILLTWCREYWQSLRGYFAAKVWMPSLAMTSLHFSVLSFSGTMTVFLIQSGFSMQLITWAEVLSAVFELGSTFIFPFGVNFLAAKRNGYSPLVEEQSDTGHSITPQDTSGGLESDVFSREETTRHGQQNDAVSRLGFWALCLVLLCAVGRS